MIRTLGDEHATIGRLLDNLPREDLDPIAQGRAFQDALEQLEVSKEALAQGLGISRSAVSNTIRLPELPELPEHLREHIAAGRITAARGCALLRLQDDPTSQDELADQILAGDMTTKDADAAARRTAKPAAANPFVDVAGLLAQLLAAKVAVTVRGDADRDRLLAQLGAAKVAA